MTTTVGATDFLADVAAAERATPLPPAAAETFAAAANARAAAVAGVITSWLAASPLRMLQQLLDQPSDTMPIFKPAIGPVVLMRHEHVLRCLERTDLFTVDLYAPEMARATDDPSLNPSALSHFLLGTDRDDLYRLDDVILRRVVSRTDEAVLTALIRAEAERCTRAARDSGAGEMDVVTTLAKLVPLRIVTDYLGVPHQERGAPSVLPGLRGGDELPLPAELLRVFTFRKIAQGRVPDAQTLFTWIKDAFRNCFNNFNPAHPKHAEWRDRGLLATEYLTAYIHALVAAYKARLERGEVVPDTMLTRLLRLQREASGAGRAALEQDLARLLGEAPPPGELDRRVSDSMIRSHVFGTAVGAVINPEEATARIADSILRLRDGEYEVRNGSTYHEAVRAARTDERAPGYAESLETLRRYALEALRLRPQGEVLLRMCVQDNSELGGIPIRKGTPVFVGYAGAMRDPRVVPHPEAFDARREERPAPFLAAAERAREAPQSQVYLQHGYGRHKCLGRYASELTMRESLRALLRMDPLERRSELEMDDQGLYAASLRVGFGAAGRT